MSARRRTATSSFGVSKRESHDSTGFYERFRPPELCDDREIPSPAEVPEPFLCGDARDLSAIADGSVALVVTSPPYFAGKSYEEELEAEGVPSSYLEYLEMLTDVFAECVRVLEPGGRIAVNVANLGRRPYRSLAADVLRILEHDLGLLLRGEIIWQKGEGASGSCAWGSWRSASNPVLRDLTERIIVASKGRFDRGLSPAAREKAGLPSRSSVMTDEFLLLTTDVWSIPPESATRVGHPAPFPLELPEALIDLYSFEGDLVLDPFMGSGTTMVAASRLGRRFVGVDLDPDFVELARRRVEEEGQAEPTSPRRAAALEVGQSASDLAEAALLEAGFSVARRSPKVPRSTLSFAFDLLDAAGRSWLVEVGGAFLPRRGGLVRSEVALRSIGRLAAARGRLGEEVGLLLLTTEVPPAGSEAASLLRAAGPGLIADVIDLFDDDARRRLAALAAGGEVEPGFWSPGELGR